MFTMLFVQIWWRSRIPRRRDLGHDALRHLGRGDGHRAGYVHAGQLGADALHRERHQPAARPAAQQQPAPSQFLSGHNPNNILTPSIFLLCHQYYLIVI